MSQWIMSHQCCIILLPHKHRRDDGEDLFNRHYERSIAAPDAAKIAVKVEKNQCNQIGSLLTARVMSREALMILQGFEHGCPKQENSNSWDCPKTSMRTLLDRLSTCDTHENLSSIRTYPLSFAKGSFTVH